VTVDLFFSPFFVCIRVVRRSGQLDPSLFSCAKMKMDDRFFPSFCPSAGRSAPHAGEQIPLPFFFPLSSAKGSASRFFFPFLQFKDALLPSLSFLTFIRSFPSADQGEDVPSLLFSPLFPPPLFQRKFNQRATVPFSSPFFQRQAIQGPPFPYLFLLTVIFCSRFSPPFLLPRQR